MDRPYGEPWLLMPTTFHADMVLELPGMPTQFLTEQLTTFWGSVDRFRSCGLLHKRGMLLYGKPGCGKTSIIKSVSEDVMARDGLVLFVTDIGLTTTVLSALRQVEPTRPVLTVIEDIESFDDDDRKRLLAILDGEAQVQHIAHLATTNYPENLDDAFTRRPGRFDVVVELRPPVQAARERYLRHLLNGGLSETRLQRLVDQTAGLTLAHLRELVACSYCLGLDEQETLARLRGRIRRPSSDGQLGFSVRFQDEEAEGATSAGAVA